MALRLVQIEEHERPRLRLIATDVLRFVEERLEVTPEVGRTALENILRERMLAVIEREMGRDLLVHWTISGAGGTSGVLRHQGLIEELLARLRRDFGHQQPLAWSLDIEMLRPAGVPIAWMEEETILGDFLRLASEYVENSDMELDLNSHLTEKHADGRRGRESGDRKLESAERNVAASDLAGGRTARSQPRFAGYLKSEQRDVQINYRTRELSHRDSTT